MAKLTIKNGTTSVILRVKVLDSSATDGSGLTGLDHTSSGLIISTIADNEATATAYTVAGSTIETIATLGTFAAPTATKCRFKEVDSTNHPGLYEIQIADARWAVSGATSLIITVSGATNAAEVDAELQLPAADLGDVARLLGMADENAYIDAITFDGSNRITAFRKRIYSESGSVGTASDVIGTYNYTMTYDGDGVDTVAMVQA